MEHTWNALRTHKVCVRGPSVGGLVFVLLVLITVVLFATALFVTVALRSPDLPGQRSGLDVRAEQETAAALPADWSEQVAV